MNAERILIGAECIGDAKWFIERAAAYAKERVVFGRPIGQNQAIAHPLADAYAKLEVAELICFAPSEAAGYITGASFDINGGDLMM